ncbi:MAG: carboxy terminal-processing peptidase [Opitutales bacterium]|nr:carboxy terminal-processing peptidase [Opitutales bacterium]
MRRLLLSLSLLLLPILSVSSLTATGLPESSHEATPLMRQETSLMIQMLEHQHIKNKRLENFTGKEIIEQFMTAVDSQKLFFTREDFDLIKAELAEGIVQGLRVGDLESLFQIHALYQKRAQERLVLIGERLTKPFALNSDQTYKPDRRESDWADGGTEMENLWERRLHYEYLQLLLADEEEEEALGILERRYERMRSNLEDTTAQDVQEVFLSHLGRLYDPHTAFFSADSFEDFRINMELALVGIGAVLSTEDGYCVIRELMPGGPAALSGELQVEDRIVAVAQEDEEPVDVVDMRLRHVVRKIRGEKDTEVTLTIIPADATDSSIRRQVTLVRDTIELTARRSHAEVFSFPINEEEEFSLGVLTVPSFYGADARNGRDAVSVTEDIRKLIGKLEEAGVSGIVLDFRGNSGGLLREAVELTGLFVGSGPVVSIYPVERRNRNQGIYRGEAFYEGPLAVLVSRYSASASEIVAGALQSYGRAIVVGDKSTHGKGSVQEMASFAPFFARTPFRGENTGAAKLTVRRFYLPDGESTQKHGVSPDISLPSFNNHLPIGEASLPRALGWDKRPNKDWEKILAGKNFAWEIDDDLRLGLKANSLVRQKELPEFLFFDEAIEWFKERQERTEYSLNKEYRRAQLDADQEFREYLEKRQAEFAKKQPASSEIRLEEEEEEAAPLDRVRADDLPPDPELGDSTDRELAEKAENFDLHLMETLRILHDLIQNTRQNGLPEAFAYRGQ